MGAWTDAIAVARRILTELVRRRRSLIFWALFPVAILLLNGAIVAERASIALVDALEAAAPTALVGAALFFSCLGGSVSTLVAEREQQTLKRLFIAPLRGGSYVLGLTIAHGAIAVGQGLLIYGTAALFGALFRGSIPLATLVLALAIVIYVGLGVILGTRFARRTEDANALIAAFGVPLLILGGTFLPADFFPDSLLQLAQFNPIYHLNEAAIAVASAERDGAALRSHLGILLGFAAAIVPVAALSYRHTVTRERRL